MGEMDDLRESLLRAAWGQIRGFTPETVRNFPAAARAIDGGAAVSDVVTAMAAASYETAFSLLFMLSCGHAEVGDDEATTGWAIVPFDLKEFRPIDDDNGSLDGMHEELLMADPTGREGQDLYLLRTVRNSKSGDDSVES